MSYEYLIILSILTLIASLLQKIFKIKLFNSLKQSLTFYTTIFTIGIIWDSFAIYRGHWIYPGQGTMGIFIGLMPLEDYLFIAVVSYFSLVVYRLTLKNEP